MAEFECKLVDVLIGMFGYTRGNQSYVSIVDMIGPIDTFGDFIPHVTDELLRELSHPKRLGKLPTRRLATKLGVDFDYSIPTRTIDNPSIKRFLLTRVTQCPHIIDAIVNRCSDMKMTAIMQLTKASVSTKRAIYKTSRGTVSRLFGVLLKSVLESIQTNAEKRTTSSGGSLSIGSIGTAATAMSGSLTQADIDHALHSRNELLKSVTQKDLERSEQSQRKLVKDLTKAAENGLDVSVGSIGTASLTIIKSDKKKEVPIDDMSHLTVSLSRISETRIPSITVLNIEESKDFNQTVAVSGESREVSFESVTSAVVRIPNEKDAKQGKFEQVSCVRFRVKLTYGMVQYYAVLFKGKFSADSLPDSDLLLGCPRFDADKLETALKERDMNHTAMRMNVTNRFKEIFKRQDVSLSYDQLMLFHFICSKTNDSQSAFQLFEFLMRPEFAIERVSELSDFEIDDWSEISSKLTDLKPQIDGICKMTLVPDEKKNWIKSFPEFDPPLSSYELSTVTDVDPPSVSSAGSGGAGSGGGGGADTDVKMKEAQTSTSAASAGDNKTYADVKMPNVKPPVSMGSNERMTTIEHAGVKISVGGGGKLDVGSWGVNATSVKYNNK